MAGKLGLGLLETLLENLDRDLNLADTDLSSVKSVTCASSATTGFKQGAMFVPCIPDAAQQALSGAGACNVTSFYTAVTTTSTDALTLAAGTELGQLKKIQMIVDGGDGTLTIADPVSAALNVITYADAGDYALCIWNGTAWRVLELGNDADGATAPGIA